MRLGGGLRRGRFHPWGLRRVAGVRYGAARCSATRRRATAAAFSAASETRLRRSENCEACFFAGFFEAWGVREALPGRVVGFFFDAV